MKKLITSALLAATLITSALGMSVSAAETGTAYGKVPATDVKITIDGKKDAIYDKGLALPATTVKHADTQKDTGAVANAKALWNGKDTIYVWVDVVDPEPVMYTTLTNAWTCDCVEVFLDYSNKLSRTRDQYRIDIKGAPSYNGTPGTVTGADVEKYGLVGYKAVATDKGYSVEFELKAYNEAIKSGMNVGFHIMLTDRHTGDTASTNLHIDACKNTPASFGYITLDAAKVAADAPKADTTTSAQTADMGVIMSIVSAAAASGALVVFKKRK